MGLVTFSGGNFGAILESWSWLNAIAIVTSAVRRRPLLIYSNQPFLQLVFYVFGHAIYNIYFHPLSKFPGPNFAAMSHVSQNHSEFTSPLCLTRTSSQLFYARTYVTGASKKTMVALHDKYGQSPSKTQRLLAHQLKFYRRYGSLGS
jgi:hypothetical protein